MDKQPSTKSTGKSATGPSLEDLLKTFPDDQAAKVSRSNGDALKCTVLPHMLLPQSRMELQHAKQWVRRS